MDNFYESKIDIMKHQKAKPSEALEILERNVAGIDVGSESHYVSVPPWLSKSAVKKFGSYTSDLRSLAEWLNSLGIKKVAIESTGMYWVGLYMMLEAHDIEVILVNAYHVKNVPGRKSDVQDCQWLRQLLSYGLLRASFQPTLLTRQLRDYVRQRQRLVKDQSRSLLHMQKAMDGMNIKLHEVISDLSGVSGQRIIRSILEGERDADKLAALADGRVKKGKSEIAKALEGFWQDSRLFELEQAYYRYKFFVQQIAQCDQKIEGNLKEQKEKYGKESVQPEHVLTKAEEKKSQRESMSHNLH